MALSTVIKPRATLVLSTDGEHEMSLAIDMATLPIPQTAEAIGLSESILRHLVDAGVVAGDKSVCDFEQAAEIAAQLAAARAPVEGQGILAPDAAAKYGFGVVSIYNWYRAGWVRALEEKPRGRVLNEGDIATARALADLQGQAAGKAVFPARPRTGRPRKN
jgi:hypothetical protein